MSEALLLKSLTTWMNNIIHALSHSIKLKKTFNHLFQIEEETSFEQIISDAPPGSRGFLIEERSSRFGNQLVRVELTSSLQIIENGIHHEQKRLAALKSNKNILIEQVAILKNHLLKNTHFAQDAFENLRENKIAINPILNQVAPPSFFGAFIEKVGSLINTWYPFTTQPQVTIDHILRLQNMLLQYEQLGIAAVPKAQAIAIDLASNIIGNKLENYAQAEAVLAEHANVITALNHKAQLANEAHQVYEALNQQKGFFNITKYFESPEYKKTQTEKYEAQENITHANKLHDDLAQALDMGNKVSAFFKAAHTLQEGCADLTEEFNNIQIGQQLLNDIEAQIEGRTENLSLLEDEYQRLSTLKQNSQITDVELTATTDLSVLKPVSVKALIPSVSEPEHLAKLFLEDKNTISSVLNAQEERLSFRGLEELLTNSSKHMQSLSADDLFNDGQDCYINVGPKETLQQPTNPIGPIHLEIPGFSAQQQETLHLT